MQITLPYASFKAATTAGNATFYKPSGQKVIGAMHIDFHNVVFLFSLDSLPTVSQFTTDFSKAAPCSEINAP